MVAPTTVQDRIADVVNSLGGDPRHCRAVLRTISAAEPNQLGEALATMLPARCIVAGTLERRLLFAEAPDRQVWLVADLSGQPHRTRSWPAWTRAEIDFVEDSRWLSEADISAVGVHRLTRPNVLLAALYHPENFPLPRFPLGISDLARAVRSTLSGRVNLLDMQLGVRLDDIINAVSDGVDIVGISATFGQYDLLSTLLDALAEVERRPLVLAGGSLTARNEHLLLQQYPWLLVARGAGEPTMADIVASWHRDLDLEDVRGLGYCGSTRGEGAHAIRRYRKTGSVPNRSQTDIFPELDLLGRTFEHRGVAQLESSRGCTHFCSFCPRGHKGRWGGVEPRSLHWIVEAMGQVFDRYPEISRTVYLVDEEFIGRQSDAGARALEVADVLHHAGFTWETSCRVDQMVRPGADRAWHVSRAQLWQALHSRGLRRCLFGVESGVTSVLRRFNKEATSDQNALAVRTLSALGIPTRYTYITFDQLMTAAELRATFDFLQRTDLLLRPLPELTPEDIVDGVRDQRFVTEHSVGAPFHLAVSYQLVSMECLIGAAYTRQVQAAGLAGQPRPSMGSFEAEFADWRIGRFSHHSQLWIDRQFAFDYTLKSLEKVLDGESGRVVRGARRVLKGAAHGLLQDMVRLLDKHRLDRPDAATLDAELLASMNTRLERLRTRMTPAVADLDPYLSPADRAVLVMEHERWRARSGWELINAADPCGT